MRRPRLCRDGLAESNAAPRDGEGDIPLTFLSYNVNHSSTLAGISTLLRSLPSSSSPTSLPSLIFIQECLLSQGRLDALVRPLGYVSTLAAAAEGTERRLVCLHRAGLVVTSVDLEPGFVQAVTVGGTVFVHVHLDSGVFGTAARARSVETVIAPYLASASSLPIMVGDFNCVTDPVDTEAYFRNKTCPPLADLVAAFGYVDAYPSMHGLPAFTFRRRGMAGSRLDRAYLPGPLAAGLVAVDHVASLSDHSALVVRLRGGLGVPSPPPPPQRASYWKLNVSLLHEPDFLPGFREMWDGLRAARQPGAPPAAWWEETAKPACRDYCIRFSRQVAHRRRETTFILQAGLQLVLDDGDWPAVAILRARLAEEDRHRLRGRRVRSRQHTLAEEEDTIFHVAAERAAPVGLPRLARTGPGGQQEVLGDPADIEDEVISYFGALFAGRHVSTSDQPEPHDSGSPFQPDFQHFDQFTQDMPRLSRHEREAVELPLTEAELQLEVEGAARGRSPSLDGLPYEFYLAVLPVLKVCLVEALNAMLEDGRLTASLRLGGVRLLPKVAGVPGAHQLRPITLLSCDYKLMTKIMVRRLINVLPTVLTTSQLCSVKGRSIFDGITAISSVVEARRQQKRPGFLFNLDFFHAYDRVCMPYVDRVLEVMGFGAIFRGWIRTLHSGAAAVFLLERLSREVAITFSVRQGDPLAMLLFIIQLEPFLWILHRVLPGLDVGGIVELVLAYVDDVDVLGDDDEDILLVDGICRMFERMSGAILNRNRKSAILGFGTWAGRQDWPLPWLHAPPALKVFGVTFAPAYRETVALSWAAVSAAVNQTLAFWSSRRLHTLRLRRDALEVFVFSKLWYLAQALPMPASVSQQLTAAAGNFLWRGHLERLAWQELHRPLLEGGLAISCLQSRAQAMWAKQACWALGGDTQAGLHLAYWLGPSLEASFPDLVRPQHARTCPALLAGLAPLLEELTAFGTVEAASPAAITAKAIYIAFTDTLPPPKVEFKLPDLQWPLVWGRLWRRGLPPEEVDLMFRLIHNVLPVRDRLGRFTGTGVRAPCPACPDIPETAVHVFTACARVHEVWEELLAHLYAFIPAVPQDQELLFLAFAENDREDDIVATLLAYVSYVWAARGNVRPPTFGALTATLRARPAPFRMLW